jgi:hypothetical protein
MIRQIPDALWRTLSLLNPECNSVGKYTDFTLKPKANNTVNVPFNSNKVEYRSVLSLHRSSFHPAADVVVPCVTTVNTLLQQNIVIYFSVNKSKVKQSRYTPWRRLGGEEV